jgi:uncharacterized protein with FMN-binding domain
MPENPLERRQRQQRRRRIILVLSIVIAVAAWAYGYFTSGIDVMPFVTDVLPEAARVEVDGRLYTGVDAEGDVVGYAATGTAPGYGGPIQVLVGIDPAGEITGIQVIEQRESPGFFRLITQQDLPGQYEGLSYDAPLKLGEDLDAVSGATLSAEGIALAARGAVRTVSREALATNLPPEQRSIQFGFPEVTLLLLYLFGYIGHRMRGGTWKKVIRWGTLLGGMIVLGFIFTVPLTIAMVISFLSGYWPDWHNNLYWYLLIGGILFVTTVDAKNPYCSWFCPFGSFQEVLCKISGAKVYKPRQWRAMFTWVQRGLAFTAVILGLALRKPGVASYEPFATLFDLRGTLVQWLLLAIIIIASLLMYRPFCNYLCPLDPVVDFIGEGRGWVIEKVRLWRNQSAKT